MVPVGTRRTQPSHALTPTDLPLVAAALRLPVEHAAVHAPVEHACKHLGLRLGAAKGAVEVLVAHALQVAGVLCHEARPDAQRVHAAVEGDDLGALRVRFRVYGLGSWV